MKGPEKVSVLVSQYFQEQLSQIETRLRLVANVTSPEDREALEQVRDRLRKIISDLGAPTSS